MNPLNLKKDFPLLQDESLVYLDSAATSLKPTCVIEAMDDYYFNYGVSVHRGVYDLSFKATEKYEASREIVADFIGAEAEEIIFTRGASSALNLVASSYGLHNLTEKDEIIVSELEHHSQVLPWMNVSKVTKAKLVYVELDKDGRITVDNFKKVLNENTKVVALNYVSNVMGYITPMKEIITLSHGVGAVVSVDAAQAAPHKVVNVKDLDCDFLAFSGHKMCGPTGVGVLYGKKELLKSMEPIEYGGDMNDNVDKFDASWKDAPYKFETGTPPIAEVIGLGRAVEYLESIGLDNILRHEQELQKYTIDKLDLIEGITIHNRFADTGIVTFNIDSVHPHDDVTFFDGDNICMRAGHHCAQLTIKWLEVPATLRVSLYLYNTYSDVDKFAESLKKAVKFFKEVGF